MLYKSKRLVIQYREKDKLILPRWTGVEMTPEDFIREMKNYMVQLERTGAEKVIWDHTDFRFQIPNDLFAWIEENVNQPAKKIGAKKIGFILGEDVMAQFSTMDAFESTQSVFAPRYFSDPSKALNWITKKKSSVINPFEKEIQLLVEKDINAGTARIQIEIGLDQLPFYLKQLKDMFNQQAIVHKTYKKYMLLTVREKEILSLIFQGLSSKAIAERLFTSIHTISTHRKNILQKLDCKNVAELMRYKIFL
jgi:DNA-binding CsgD family transcriptional regulator